MAHGEMAPWRRGRHGLRHRGRDPFESFGHRLEALHREMDRLLEGLRPESAGRSLLSEDWSQREVVPRLDVSEDDKAVRIEVELPGMNEKDIDVTLSDRLLTIRGEKREEKEARDKDYYRRERAYGGFRRSIEVPTAVDASKIEAKFDRGVLTIELPKTKEAQEKTKRIEVKAA